MNSATVQRFAPLFRNLVRREVRQRYKASAFGVAWTLVNPLVTVAAYWFVFRFVFPTGSNDPYALFLFVGLACWTIFMGGAQAAAPSLVANASLVTKIKFPRQIIPLSAMVGTWFTACAMLVIALPLCWFFGHGRRATWAALPLSIFLLCIFTVGFGLVVAAANVYFRDTEHILSAIAIPWFFLTPILFDLNAISSEAHQWAVMVIHFGNPVSPFVLSVRSSLFEGQWPAAGDLVYCAIAAPIMLAIGVTTFRRLEPEMAVEL